MFTIVAGLLIGISLLLYSISGISENSKLYLDFYSLLLVVGGTISASLMSVTWKNLKELGVTLMEAFSKPNLEEEAVSNEIQEIAEKAFAAKKISSLNHESENEFIQRGVRLLQSEMEPEFIRKVLASEIQSQRNQVITNSEIIKMIAKYPPSFGMVGTILGLIGMLEDMSISTGLDKIGIKMALALVTTLYGLLFANYVLIPLSEVIVNKAQNDIKLKKKALEAFIIIATNKNDPVLVKEFLGVLQKTQLEGTSEQIYSEAI